MVGKAGGWQLLQQLDVVGLHPAVLGRSEAFARVRREQSVK